MVLQKYKIHIISDLVFIILRYFLKILNIFKTTNLIIDVDTLESSKQLSIKKCTV